ncbi:LexA family transcriptional regulator [Pedobacter sp. PAMC26386]|nr:LexA family transcriptional regulator [Pedobacter sp. PAMC26386]
MFRKTTSDQHNESLPLKNPGKVTGFPSPVHDYSQDKLHIIQRLVKDPTHTFYFEMDNNDLLQTGICKGALLVVDRSVKAKNGSIVVVNHEGHWIIRMLVGNQYLMAGSLDARPIKIDGDRIYIFGVVTWSCNPLAAEGAMGVINFEID